MIMDSLYRHRYCVLLLFFKWKLTVTNVKIFCLCNFCSTSWLPADDQSITSWSPAESLSWLENMRKSTYYTLYNNICYRSRGQHSPTWPTTFSSWWNLEAFSTGNTWLSSLRSNALGGPSVAGLMKLKGFRLRDATSGTGRKQGGGSCL